MTWLMGALGGSTIDLETFLLPDLSITEKQKKNDGLHKIPLLSNKCLGLPCKILFRQPTQYLTALGVHSTPTIFSF